MDLYYPHITKFQELTLHEERLRQQRLELEATRGRSTWQAPRRATSAPRPVRRVGLFAALLRA
jgi:hypothetical protein